MTFIVLVEYLVLNEKFICTARFAAKIASNAPNLNVLVWIKRTQSYLSIDHKDIPIVSIDGK